MTCKMFSRFLRQFSGRGIVRIPFSKTTKMFSLNKCRILKIYKTNSLRKKCPDSELFWSVFSRIRTEYGKIRSTSPYSVRMRENADQSNSEYKTVVVFCKWQRCSRTQSNIKDGVFWWRWLKALFLQKTFNPRSLRGFWVRLWLVYDFG